MSVGQGYKLRQVDLWPLNSSSLWRLRPRQVNSHEKDWKIADKQKRQQKLISSLQPLKSVDL